MDTLHIRKAVLDDVEKARLLTNQSWLATYSPLIGEDTVRTIISEKHSAELFEDQAARDDAVFLVALDQDTVIGHCYGFPEDGFYVDRLHVDPAAKGRGVGRALLRDVEQTIGKGVRCWLDVLKGNEAAVRFYQRVGYAEVGETDTCGGLAGIPAVVFEKTS